MRSGSGTHCGPEHTRALVCGKGHSNKFAPEGAQGRRAFFYKNIYKAEKTAFESYE